MAAAKKNGLDYEETTMDMKQMENFDYVRFTVADIHGIGRCKSVPRRHYQHYAKRGVDLFAGRL